MKLYNTIKESLAYELDHYPEEYGYQNLPPVNLERTARRIWQYMHETNRLDWYRSRQEWEAQESAHNAVLDWLSMFEPTFTQSLAYEFECWKCDEWHHGTAETQQELKEIIESIGVTVRLINN